MDLAKATAKLINDQEFDHVFRITEDGFLVDDVRDVWAPDWITSTEDGDLDYEGSWEALMGFTGQWHYHGPIMHDSETVGRDIANAMIEEPGIYVLCPVSAAEKNEDGESVFVGWCILRRSE